MLSVIKQFKLKSGLDPINDKHWFTFGVFFTSLVFILNKFIFVSSTFRFSCFKVVEFGPTFHVFHEHYFNLQVYFYLLF